MSWPRASSLQPRAKQLKHKTATNETSPATHDTNTTCRRFFACACETDYFVNQWTNPDRTL